MNSNDELFREVFKTLHKELNAYEKKPTKDETSSLSTLSIIPPLVSKKIVVQKQLLEMKYKEEKQLLQYFQNRFEYFTSQTDEVLYASRLACRIRLHQQKRTANKRLQELIFEVLGEYKKALLRAQRRESYLRNYARVQVTLTTWNHRWQRFLFFLEIELSKKAGSIRSGSPVRQKSQARPANIVNTSSSFSTHLSPSLHTQELHHLTKLLSQRLGLISEENFQIMTAVRFRRISAVRTAPTTALTLRLDHTIEELQTTLDILATWLAGSNHFPATSETNNNNNNSGNSNINNNMMPVSAQTLLSNDHIAWLHPTSSAPHLCDTLVVNSTINTSNDSEKDDLSRFFQSVYMQYSSSLFNSRVYVCLEERQLLQELQRLTVNSNTNNNYNVFDIETTSAILSSLQDCYVGSRPPKSQANDALQKLRFILSSSCLQVTQHMKQHRSQANLKHEKLVYWPDIIAATLTMPNSDTNNSNNYNTNSITLHFAPATILNLLEASPEHNNLTDTLQLFCVSVMPLPAPNSVLSTNNTNSNTINDIKNSHNNRSSMSSDLFRLCLVSLKHSIVSRLYRGYFPLIMSSVSETTLNSSWGALQLLPDHSRLRHITTHNPRDTKDAKPILDKLHHYYALIADENQFMDNTVTNSEDTSSSNNNNKKVPIACVYLVQLCPEAKVNKEETDFLKLFPDISLSSKKNTNRNNSKNNKSSNITDNDNAENNTNNTIVVTNNEFKEQYTMDEEMFRGCVLEEQRRHCKQTLIIRPKTNNNTHKDNNNNNTNEIIPKNLLLAEQLNNNSNNTTTNNKREWEIAVMSELCFWRACLCHSSNNILINNINDNNNNNNNVLLCRYHQELRLSLDRHLPTNSSSTAINNINGNNSESAKFFPKKPPIIPLFPPNNNSNTSSQEVELWQNKRDLQLLRAASTLLQELWDGRLKNTVKIFAKKIALDMRQRAVTEAALVQMKRLLLAYPSNLQTPTNNIQNNPTNNNKSNSNNKAIKSRSNNNSMNYNNSKHSSNYNNTNSNTSNNNAEIPSFDVAQLLQTADLHTLQRLSQFQLPTTPTWAMLRNNPNINLKTPPDPTEIEGNANNINNNDTAKTVSSFSTGVITAQQTQALSFLQHIKELEAAVTQEIRYFTEELRVFPATEITHMRRDIRAFKDLQEQILNDTATNIGNNSNKNEEDPQYLLLSVLSEEVKLCDRKWNLLKQRRLAEEEQRLILLRRMQRQRQTEENQMKDPANFNFSSSNNNNSNNNNNNRIYR